MLSTPRASGRGGDGRGLWLAVLCLFAAIVSLALIVGSASANNGNPCPPSSHNPGGSPPCGFPEEPAPVPQPEPEPEPEPETMPPPTVEGPTATPTPTSEGHGGVLGTTAKGGHPAPTHHSPPTVTVAPEPAPPVIRHTKKKQHKAPKVAAFPAPVITPPPPAAPESNPERSTFAERLLTPGDLHLDAEHLGKGGLLALLLAALLYLPVTIFNKATEKNHEAIRRWFERPRAVLAAAFGWIPVSRHPLLTLTGGVLASAGLFAFIEPGFPTEDGALQYLIGMVIGFALVSTVFFSTWRLVLHRLEPDGEGQWRIFPPYIALAAFLVAMARLAHFIPGVVLGTVAEYQPARRLSTRTAGIRVLITYGVLIVLGLAAWFAWVPIDHAAAEEGASSLTLILDSALAITFVSALESVAFGLIPMTFLDGADLFRWRKGLWAAMWGGALLWFSVVIMRPALSTYNEHAEHGSIFWFILLFSSLMLVALATWGFFRVRELREARSSAAAS